MQTVDGYLQQLQGKGFQFKDDAIGFIYFGKHLTNAPEEVAIAAIELTLKAQRGFEGSFYVSLLETLVSNNIQSRKAAIEFVKSQQLLSV